MDDSHYASDLQIELLCMPEARFGLRECPGGCPGRADGKLPWTGPKTPATSKSSFWDSQKLDLEVAGILRPVQRTLVGSHQREAAGNSWFKPLVVALINNNSNPPDSKLITNNF